LGSEVRKPKVLLCYNYQNGITNEEEDFIFVIKLKLFSIGIINLPETIQFVKATDVGIMDTYVKTIISKQGFEVHSIEKKIPSNRYEPEVVLEDKVYLDTYYKHQPKSVVVDEILATIKAQGLQIARWTLDENQQLMKFNLETNVEPHMVNINA